MMVPMQSTQMSSLDRVLSFAPKKQYPLEKFNYILKDNVDPFSDDFFQKSFPLENCYS